jgi:hypothetical protein
MDEARELLAGGATLAALLEHNVEVVVSRLRAEGTASGSPLTALVAARTAAEVIDEVTLVLVGDARSDGHTWAEIGRLLRISRQAAQQRFTEAADGAPAGSDRLAERALQIVEQLRDHDWAGVTADWDEVMHDQLGADDLRKVWTRLRRNAGPLVAVGRPSVVPQGVHRIVDVPLAFKRAPMRARVTFNLDDSVAGLLLMTPDRAGWDT